MDLHTISEIRSSLEYKELLARRRALIVPLTALTLVIYYAFILVLAFFPDSLSTRIGEGVTTIGILLGLGVIFCTFAITGIYVRKANREIEDLLIKLQQKYQG